jgi:signal transduction histidine kinase
LPTVWGDRDRLGQLMANLIGNAIKYNRSRDPWVEVGSVPGADDTWVTVSVRDNGIGIDPQFHAKIFQLFRRLHTREEFEGTGAGLAICAKIVQAHGGRIWVESEPGQGATFLVTLRRAAAEVSRP